MYIVSVIYKTGLDKVDNCLKEHIDYLQKYTDLGIFILAGRKVPRSGGIILVNTDSRESLDTIISEDPFSINDVANFEVVEFIPSIISKELEHLKKD